MNASGTAGIGLLFCCGTAYLGGGTVESEPKLPLSAVQASGPMTKSGFGAPAGGFLHRLFTRNGGLGERCPGHRLRRTTTVRVDRGRHSVRLLGGSMLDNGTQMPVIAGKDLEGNDITIGELGADSWTAVLFYRGDW